MHLVYNCGFGKVRQKENILLLCPIHAYVTSISLMKILLATQRNGCYSCNS